MADTRRTLNDLLINVFADGQADRSITAQDIRDLIVTLAPPFFRNSFNNNATATTINTGGVFENIAGTYVAGSTRNFTVTAGGLITYTGTVDSHMHIVANLDVTPATNNEVISVQWHKNGSPIAEPMENKLGATTDVQNMAIHSDIMMSDGDTLQLKIANVTGASTSNFTVKNCYTFTEGMIM